MGPDRTSFYEAPRKSENSKQELLNKEIKTNIGRAAPRSSSSINGGKIMTTILLIIILIMGLLVLKMAIKLNRLEEKTLQAFRIICDDVKTNREN